MVLDPDGVPSTVQSVRLVPPRMVCIELFSGAEILLTRDYVEDRLNVSSRIFREIFERHPEDVYKDITNLFTKEINAALRTS